MEAHELRSIAVAANCDPRSVQRFLKGDSLRPIVAERIAAALSRQDAKHTLAQALAELVAQHETD